MSEEKKSAPQPTPEQISAGLSSFITTIEEEIDIHKSHPQWADITPPPRAERNLIVRAELIITMLEDAVKQFSIPEDDKNVIRLKATKSYFDSINR